MGEGWLNGPQKLWKIVQEWENNWKHWEKVQKNSPKWSNVHPHIKSYLSDLSNPLVCLQSWSFKHGQNLIYTNIMYTDLLIGHPQNCANKISPKRCRLFAAQSPPRRVRGASGEVVISVAIISVIEVLITLESRLHIKSEQHAVWSLFSLKKPLERNGMAGGEHQLKLCSKSQVTPRTWLDWLERPGPKRIALSQNTSGRKAGATSPQCLKNSKVSSCEHSEE